ncbi:MAG: EAL domain-containing protein [Thermodesulfobium sp.]
MICDEILNNFFNSNIFGVYIYQENGIIVFANSRFSQIVGYDTEELLKMSFYDLLADHKEEVIEYANRRLNGEFFSIEIENHYYKCKNGLLPVQISAYTINYNEKPSGLVIVLDKTKEKSIEKLFYALTQINQLIVREDKEDTLLESICRILVKDVGYAIASVGYIDEKTKLLKIKFIKSQTKEQTLAFKRVTVGVDPDTPYGKGSVSRAYHTGNVVVISDVMKNEDLKYWQDYYTEINAFSICSIPILKDNKVKYIIAILDSMRLSFTDETIRLLKEVQTDISFAIGKIEYQNNLTLLQKAVENAHEWFLVTNKRGKILYVNDAVVKISGYSKDDLIGSNINILESGFHDADFYIDMWKTLEQGLIFYCKFINKRKDGSLFYLDTIIVPIMIGNRIQKYVSLAKDVSGNYFDALTGLLNRISFYNEIDSFIKKFLPEKPISFIIKINPLNFTVINQAFGFDKGNLVLMQIAQRLKSFFGVNNAIAKLESDRFAVFVNNVNSEDGILNLAYGLLDVLTKSYDVDDQAISVSFNIGIGIYPKDGETAAKLVDRALIALLDARIRGENSIGFFRREFGSKAKEKLVLRNDLEKAILNKEFVLYYQPYVDKDLNIVGAESLLRWKKKDEVILPMKFIPFLEQTGLIMDVEEFVFDLALQTISKLSLNEIRVPLSVNFSYKTLKRDNIADILSSKIRKYNIDPGMIRIEIIERIFMEDLQYTQDLIEKLTDSGIRFMLDDFGTGYSSLSYISKLKIDYLKIDISFVRNILDEHTKNVIETIVFLSKKLNIKSIAEGVETVEQFEILKDIGCDYFQGFLFSKPLPQDVFEDFVLTNEKILI